MKDSSGSKKSWLWLLLVGVIFLGGQLLWSSMPNNQRELVASNSLPGKDIARNSRMNGPAYTEPDESPDARLLSGGASLNEGSPVSTVSSTATSTTTEDAVRDTAAMPAPTIKDERAIVMPSADITLPTEMLGVNGEIISTASISIPDAVAWAAAQNDGILRLARGEKPNFIRREPRSDWEREPDNPTQGERAQEQR